MTNFADRIVAACQEKNSIVCVGIDPRLEFLPDSLLSAALEKHGHSLEAASAAYAEFGQMVIDAVAKYAVAVKVQSAFFEMVGPAGMVACRQVVKHAQAVGLVAISDVKRSDIGTTAQAYTDGFLGEMTVGDDALLPWGVDAVTVSPYLGSDGIVPFVNAAKAHHGGLFVLVKTSNKSSGELQDLVADGRPVYEHVAQWVADNAEGLMGTWGYSALGAVVGATYPEQLRTLRALMPKTLLLIPGYGAQGGGPAEAKPGLNPDGLGAVVNASRSIIYAFRDETWAADNPHAHWTDAVRDAARTMRDDLNEVRP